MLLALVAMLWAQVFGMQRGFVCDCGGVERLTMLDHCHGPHEHDCEAEEHEMPSHDRHDHDEEEPIHEHPALIETLQAEKTAATAFSTFQAPLLILLPPDGFLISDIFPAKTSPFHPPRENCRAGPLWPPRLSHTIALLI